MKVYKDERHSVSLRPFIWQGKRYLMLCVGLYAHFDAQSGKALIRSEQQLWQEAPPLFAALGQPPVLDAGLPKPGAEVLLAGFARAPGESLASAQEVAFRVGGVARRLLVFGERGRLPGGGFTEPEPFRAMPLVWERAFGGPGYAPNPLGRGLAAEAAGVVPAPNLEDPRQRLLLPNDMPRPVCPLPRDMANPERRELSGTYDQAWLENRWPAYPDDCAPEFFYSAQAAQRLGTATGGPLYFQGGEEVEMAGLRHDRPLLRARLPHVRLRAFVLTCERFTPFDASGGPLPRLPYMKDLDGPGIFQEVELRCDTVWLFPDLPGALMLYRGLLPVEDDEMDDVLRVLVADEQPADAPRSLEFYREELRKRAHPSLEIDLAPLAAAQGRVSKAVKKARDLPKTLERIKRRFLGQSPVMPVSIADLAHDVRTTIATGRATLDGLEKQVLALREQFSHLMSFDLGIFARMRGALDEREKNLEKIVQAGEAALKQAGEGLGRARETAGRVPAQAMPSLLEKLDAIGPDGPPAASERLNPWHDRGFGLVVAARRRLRRHERLPSLLEAWGFEAETPEESWLGYGAASLEDRPENWGLPPGPAFTLPAGLYVPRFKGKALTSLDVYPLDIAAGRLAGPGEPASCVRVPGSDPSPLILPAARPEEGAAVLLVPEALSALLAEQEVGDFCHVLAAADPAELAAPAAAGELPFDWPPSALAAPAAPASDSSPSAGTTPLLPILLVLPPEGGEAALRAWRAACPGLAALRLPEGCPHCLALAGQGRRLRRLVLDVLPPALAAAHDFDIPLPPKDAPPAPFSLNLPLPDREEMQGRIEALINDIRGHFPDPRTFPGQEAAKALERLRGGSDRANLGPEASAKLNAALAAAAAPRPAAPAPGVGELIARARSRLDTFRQTGLANLPAGERAGMAARLDAASGEISRLGERLAPLAELQSEGRAKLADLRQGVPPQEVREAFARQGVDPDALRPLSREEVERILAGDKNLERRNLQGLDLSGLDFSKARLGHAICAKAGFRGACLDGADFTFTLAPEADFSSAGLRGAQFKHTVLQKAVLRGADLTAARLELTTLGETDCREARFEAAGLKLCNFGKAALDGAHLATARLDLCSFSEASATGADFSRVRAFKCLFQKMSLRGAVFREARLNQCLFQGVEAEGLCLAGADLRKFYADMESDLSGADFSRADLRQASLRQTRLCGADFWQARLEEALLAQCDLSRARLDGLAGAGCRFIKCDLTGADLSHSQLFQGALRKCRLAGATLEGANLYAADLTPWLVDEATVLTNVNLRRTRLEGRQEALIHVTQRDS